MKKIIVGVLAIIIILVSLVVELGAYPFMKVNSIWISQRRVDAHISALKVMEKNIKDNVPEFSYASDLELDVLNFILTDALVTHELQKEFEAAVLENLLRDKVNSALSSDFDLAAKELYGLNPKTGKEILLMPQARADILRSQFILQDREWEPWLHEARYKAEITLFSRKFSWDGNTIIRD